jgi:uncharacterized glyoxalase superfamily protein PhnB
MPESASQAGTPKYAAPDVIPAIRYRDAPAAIEWLERAFGFERHMVMEGQDGRIEHAELRVGSGMVMLGSVPHGAFDIRVPSDLGETTAGFYVIVEDPDAHCQRAREAGAEILMELTDQDYGSRDYTARDPEGHVWHFGTYRPTGD